MTWYDKTNVALQVIVFAGGVNDFATGAPNASAWLDGYANFIQNVRILTAQFFNIRNNLFYSCANTLSVFAASRQKQLISALSAITFTHKGPVLHLKCPMVQNL